MSILLTPSGLSAGVLNLALPPWIYKKSIRELKLMAAKYESAQRMREVAEEYFKQYPHPDNFTDRDDKQKAVNIIQSGLIPTLNGLSLYLGFDSIQSLYDYQRKEGFKQVLNWLRAKIGSYWELNLNSKFANGAMKWLDAVQPDTFGDKSKIKDAPPVALVVYVGSKQKETPINAEFTEVKAIEGGVVEIKRGRPKGSKNKPRTKKKPAKKGARS